MENLGLLIFGIVLCVLGSVNMTGNVSSIHAYNRRNVREDDIPKYGRAIGLGTVIAGVSLILGFFLTAIGFAGIMEWVILCGIVIGLGFILYAQFKYNKGIF